MTSVAPEQVGVLRVLAPHLPAGTYLAGGVAVALTLDHRRSLDVDLFVPDEFDEERVEEALSAGVPGLRVTGRGRGTLHAEVDGVPLSLLSYRYALLAPPHLDGAVAVRIASLNDLACMKLSAIAGRGAAKDFWDLDGLLGHGVAGGELGAALALFRQKYPRADPGHVVRSLAYFGEADGAPLPLGLDAAAWSELKARFRRRVVDLG